MEPPVEPLSGPHPDEALRRQIDEERRQLELAHKDGRTYFSNFSLRLPITNDLFGWHTHYKGVNDKKFREMAGSGARKYSDIFLGQTPVEFFATIEAVMEETGVTLEKITEVDRKTQGFPMGTISPARIEAHLAFERTVAPIYFRLREIGYTRYDLTS